MDIKIHSFGTSESLDFRCILEGMYRKVDRVEQVLFPDANTVQLILNGDYKYEYEYGIHQLIRISPRDVEGRRHASYVMVEIDGKTREYPVACYSLIPNRTYAKNIILNKASDNVYDVLNGKPLGLEKKCEDLILSFPLEIATYQAA